MLIPLTAPLFVPFLLGFQTNSLFLPSKKHIQYASYISEEEDEKRRQITSDSWFPPRLPSSPLKSVEQAACVPSFVRGEPHRRSAVPVRNYAPCPVSSALRPGNTEECRWKQDNKPLFDSNPFQDLCRPCCSRLSVRDHAGIPFNSLGGTVEPL